MTNRSTARTAVTAVSTERILLNPGEAGVKVVTGKLYEDMAPGTVVAFDKANNYWIKLVNTTASHNLRLIGVVGYKKRVNQTTNALKIITDNWDISEAEDKRAPIIVSGICVANITDQNAALDPQHGLMASSTAGSLTALALTTGYLTAIMCATVADYVIDNDTRAIIALGKFMGEIWGSS